MIKKPKASARVELEGPDFVDVENYRRKQPKIPSRADAILELIRQGLALRPAHRGPDAAAQPRETEP